MRTFHEPVQEFEAESRYDLIVTNPPYYVNALKPPNPGRERARHDRTLRHDEIVSAASRLLTPDGRLSIILPRDASNPFEILAARQGLYCTVACNVYSKAGKPPIRRLLEFRRTPSPTQQSSLCILDPQGHPSPEYRSLVGDFYINF